MQPLPDCPPKPADKNGDPLTKQEGPTLPSLIQTEGPDFAKPPTPTFKDTSKCNYQYVSPNPDLMQPEAECPDGKKQQ